MIATRIARRADSPPSSAYLSGLIVRRIDNFLTTDDRPHGAVCAFVIADGSDFAGIASSVAESRDWNVITLDRSRTPPQCLRLIARALRVDPTGTRSNICRQIMDGLRGRGRREVVIVVGDANVIRSMPALLEAATSPMLAIVLLCRPPTFARANSRPETPWGFVEQMITARDRHQLSVALVRTKGMRLPIGT